MPPEALHESLAHLDEPRERGPDVMLHVIVPARNEELNVPYFYGRAREALDSIPGLDWSIVFINNASEDGTLEQMLGLRAADRRVKIITLSRNFGYHAALMAGLSSVESDYFAMVDVDCEDPPELLVDFHKAMQDGVQIAFGVRSQRDEPRSITFGRKLFYIANRAVADDSDIVMWMGEFSMFTRQVRDAVLAPKTTFVSLRAEMGYVGFSRVGIPYRRAKRKHGATHYNLWRMTVYAIGSILSGTTFPLRLVLYLAALVSVGFPLYLCVTRPTGAQAALAAAFTSLYFLVISIPLISLYLARVYKNVVQRPLFVIDQTRTRL